MTEIRLPKEIRIAKPASAPFGFAFGFRISSFGFISVRH
jgi:hypothetical protein